MSLKKKVLAGSMAATLMMSAAAFAPISWNGAVGKADAAALPTEASYFKNLLDQVYSKLSSTELASVTAAKAEINATWTDYNTATAPGATQAAIDAWNADVAMINPIWNDIQATATAHGITTMPFTKDRLFMMVLHLSYGGHSDGYQGLEAIRTMFTDVLNGLIVIGSNDTTKSMTDVSFTDAQALAEAFKSYIGSIYTNNVLLSSLSQDGLKSIANNFLATKKNTSLIAKALDGLNISAASINATRDNFLNKKVAGSTTQLQYPHLQAAYTALKNAAFKVALTYLPAPTTTDPGTNPGTNPGTGTGTGTGTGNGTGGVVVPDEGKGKENVGKAFDNLKDKLANSDNPNQQEGLLKAIEALEKVLRDAAKVDVSKSVTVTNGEAKVTLDVSKLLNALKAVKAIAEDANSKVKEATKDSDTKLQVVATLDLGKVDADKAVVPISDELVKAGKDNSVDAFDVKVNGVSLTIPLNEIGSGTTLTIEKKDKSTATSATSQDVVSDVYEFTFTGVDHFGQPVEVRIPVNASDISDKDLLTLAKILNGEMIYFGGKYNEESGEFEAIRNSFSTYTVVENKVSFDDTASVQDWAGRQIQVVAAKGIVEGREQGQFAPNAKVTRAEFAKMLVKTFGLEDTTATENFSDVNTGDWFQVDVASAVKAGLINGRTDTSFAPNETITRAEMATMAARALKAAGYKDVTDLQTALQGFKDASSINSTLQSGVALAANLGIVIGEEGDNFNPNNDSTRAQATVVIYRLLSK